MKDPLRLGPRRNARDYSVHQRSTGKYCNENIRENCYLRCAAVLLVCSRKLRIQGLHLQRAKKHQKVAQLLLSVVCDIRRPRLLIPDKIVSKVITIDGFTAQQTDMYFGFSAVELHQLFDHIDFPEAITLNEGRHQFKVPGQKAFLYMLYHFRSPSARQTLDTAVFGYDYSVLSKLFNASVQYVHDHHSDKFRNIPSIIHKLPVFNAAIIAKIVDSFPGTAIPADAVHCSLFADNCRFEIARPTGPYHVQQAYYSGQPWISVCSRA